MKIIDKGNPWWLGKKVTCNKCGCVMELEMEDRPKLEPDFIEYGDIVQCPTCINIISVSDNPERQKRQEQDEARDNLKNEVLGYDLKCLGVAE